jgi:hypothetical protein
MYRRILKEDTDGVWGRPGHKEVRYLLQSQQSDWPNYTAKQVLALSVPSIVQEPAGEYFLYFDGFLPDDAPPAPATPNNPFNMNPKHRRPFFAPLKVHVPWNGGVSMATDEELAAWITVSKR